MSISGDLSIGAQQAASAPINPEEERKCSICWEASPSEENAEEYVKLPCGHDTIHQGCLVSLLKRDHKCPLCSSKIFNYVYKLDKYNRPVDPKNLDKLKIKILDEVDVKGLNCGKLSLITSVVIETLVPIMLYWLLCTSESSSSLLEKGIDQLLDVQGSNQVIVNSYRMQFAKALFFLVSVPCAALNKFAAEALSEIGWCIGRRLIINEGIVFDTPLKGELYYGYFRITLSARILAAIAAVASYTFGLSSHFLDTFISYRAEKLQHSECLSQSPMLNVIGGCGSEPTEPDFSPLTPFNGLEGALFFITGPLLVFVAALKLGSLYKSMVRKKMGLPVEGSFEQVFIDEYLEDDYRRLQGALARENE